MIFGIDVGNYETKTDNYKKIYSRVKSGHNDLNEDEIKVIYNDEEYTVGTKDGIPFLGSERYFTTEYTLCLLTAVALSTKDLGIKAKIVASMPPLHFNNKDLRKRVKEHILNLDTQEITINGDIKVIEIVNAEVFCENSAVWSDPGKYTDQTTVSFDIGGGTWDINQFDGLKLTKYTSEPLGTLSLYEDVKKEIMSRYAAKVETADIDKMIGKDEYEIKQEMKDITFIKKIMSDMTQKAINTALSQNFNMDNSKLELIGGGAAMFEPYIKKYYPKIVIPQQAQFRTAVTNKKIGEFRWHE